LSRTKISPIYEYEVINKGKNVITRIEDLLRFYRGLRKDDLDYKNPDYSCVLCFKDGCHLQGVPKRSCPFCVLPDERRWAKRYNFKI